MIKIENLHKSFRRLSVLAGVDLDIPTGQSVVIIGQSGCGKSVLLKHLVALLRPDLGRVTIDGRDVFTLSSGELIFIPTGAISKSLVAPCLSLRALNSKSGEFPELIFSSPMTAFSSLNSHRKESPAGDTLSRP
jgi:ABC-type glutathione transport system ATPase component